MKHPKYQIRADDERFLYEFYSDRPKGRIKKTVIYSQIEGNLFNLAFGDWNDTLNKLDDFIRTNNGDRDKVLATVASTAIDFTDRFPNAEIFTEGSTPARTRLYQMGICSHWKKLEKNLIFKVIQSTNGGLFEKGSITEPS